MSRSTAEYPAIKALENVNRDTYGCPFSVLGISFSAKVDTLRYHGIMKTEREAITVYRKALSALLAAVLFLTAVLWVCAENNAVSSNNSGKQDYSRWSQPVKSYLVSCADSFMRVEAVEDRVVIETYSSNFTLKSSRSIPYELPIFGGFYESPDSYFLVFGKENLSEDDNAEVIRVVRYGKDWSRIGAASLYGENTRRPFIAGSLRMASCEDMLYIRTSHEMYKADDGYCHQANLMIAVKISTMTVTDSFSGLADYLDGCVSESFNQFVTVDADTLLAVDHGDGYPRSIVLFRYGAKAGEEKFFSWCESVDVFPISGQLGENDTGVSIGGFEFSDSAYLIVGNSAKQSEVREDNAVRNIFVTITPKTDFSSEKTKCTWLTSYPENDKTYYGKVSTPQIVKTNEGFIVLWVVKNKLNYAFLDGSGSLIGKVMTANGALSDCKPMFVGHEVYWYCTQNSQPVFYSIDLWSPEAVKIIPICAQSNPTDLTEQVPTTGPMPTEPTEPTVPTLPTEPTLPTAPTSPSEDDHDAICPSRDFGDVPGRPHWAHDGIDFAISHGLFNGMSETRFEPDTTMTRAMLVTVLWRSSDMPEYSTNPFSDVPQNGWYSSAVRWASACDIVNGVGAAQFDPQGNITREQLATILYRFALYKNKEAAERKALSEYSDCLCVSSWAEDAMQWAVAEGIISGTQSQGKMLLQPRDYATRAQVATILMRF